METQYVFSTKSRGLRDKGEQSERKALCPRSQQVYSPPLPPVSFEQGEKLRAERVTWLVFGTGHAQPCSVRGLISGHPVSLSAHLGPALTLKETKRKGNGEGWERDILRGLCAQGSSSGSHPGLNLSEWEPPGAGRGSEAAPPCQGPALASGAWGLQPTGRGQEHCWLLTKFCGTVQYFNSGFGPREAGCQHRLRSFVPVCDIAINTVSISHVFNLNNVSNRPTDYL